MKKIFNILFVIALFTLSVNAQVSYYSNGGFASGTSGSVDVPYPATVNADDILICYVMNFVSGATISTPSGWTQIYKDESPSSRAFAWYAKRATGSESGTLTVTTSGTLWSFGVMVSFSGVTTSDPFYESAVGTPEAGSDDVATAGEITSTGDNELAIVMTGIMKDVTVGAWSGGYTEDLDISTTDLGDQSISIASQLKTSAGVVASETATYSASGYNAEVAFFLIPATGGASGWTGSINGVTDPTLINGKAASGISKVIGK